MDKNKKLKLILNIVLTLMILAFICFIFTIIQISSESDDEKKFESNICKYDNKKNLYNACISLNENTFGHKVYHSEQCMKIIERYEVVCEGGE